MINKKPLVALGLICTTCAFLSGCEIVSTAPKKVEVEYIPQVVFKGNLTRLKESIDANVTHLLTLEDGAEVYLRSLVINLDNIRYIDAMVEVRGSKLSPLRGNEVLDVQSIDVIDSEEDDPTQEVAEEEGKWKKYEDMEFGFTMNYLASWEVDSSRTEVVFSSKAEKEEDISKVTVREVKNRDNVSLEEYLDIEGLSSLEMKRKGFAVSKIGSQQIAAYKQEKEDGAVVFYLAKPLYVYEVLYAPGAESAEENIFYDMVLSLSFFDFGEEGFVDSLEEEAVESNDASDSSNEAKDLEDEKKELNPPLVEGKEVMKDEKKEEEVKEKKEKVDRFEGRLEVDEGYRIFESLPYKFQAQYPKNWYYSGKYVGSDEVFHSYLFSDEPVEEDNELIVLDIMKTPLPSGSKMTLSGNKKKAVVVSHGTRMEVYVERSGSQAYRFSGPESFKEVILGMASGVID